MSSGFWRVFPDEISKMMVSSGFKVIFPDRNTAIPIYNAFWHDIGKYS